MAYATAGCWRGLELEVKVPANATGVVYVPAERVRDITVRYRFRVAS